MDSSLHPRRRSRRHLRPLTAAALAVVATIVALASPAGAAFGDVEDDRYYAEAVTWMVDEGITTGIEPGCFGPDLAVTRGQIGAFLHRLEETRGAAPAAPPHPFADVTADYQHEPVGWLYANGITTGVTGTTFAPDAAIRRGDFAVMLWRYAGSPEPTTDHPFVDVGRAYQDDAIAWLAEYGLTTGTSPTTFSPEGVITRAEAATFLYRYADPGPVASRAEPADCTRELRTALQANGLTATEARCAAPYLTSFEIPYMVDVVQDRAVASWELMVAASDVATNCLTPDRIADLTRLFL